MVSLPLPLLQNLTCGALSVADAAVCLFENHISVCPLRGVHLSVWSPISSAVMGKRHLQEMESCVSDFS